MNIWPKTVTAQFQNGDLKESKNELYKTKACKLLRVVKINKTTHGAKRGSCSRALKVKWVSGREGIKNSEVEMSWQKYTRKYICACLCLLFLFFHSIKQLDRYSQLILANSTAADTGEYSCWLQPCSGNKCRKDETKTGSTYIFFTGN